MRMTPAETGRRAYFGFGRGTVKKVDDSKLMQTIDMGLHYGESKTAVEHPHEYGFTSVPLIADNQSTGAAAGGSSTGGGKSAEVFSSFVNGNRGHAIAQTIGDRRHRLMNCEPGETGLYDDQTKQVHLARDAVYVTVPKGKKIFLRIMPGDKPSRSGGQQKASASADAGGGGGGSGSGNSQQLGQDPWAKDKAKPLCSFEISEEGVVIKHQKKITHAITDDQGNIKYSHSIDENGKFNADVSQVDWNKK